jgi:osmoprotectant transport system permease protein
MSVIQYAIGHRGDLAGWLAWHAWLSALPVVLGLLAALPLGWLAHRQRLAYSAVITITGLLYTIPSLALFVLLPLLLHTRILDPVNVIVALTIYSVALLVRVVADGLAGGSLQRLVTVELPIAVPVIIAGLRVATVSNVSLVSVAALLGVPQLGLLFTSGFQLFDTDPIVLGIAGCLLLALAFDLVIVAAGRLLTPWRRAVSRS